MNDFAIKINNIVKPSAINSYEERSVQPRIETLLLILELAKDIISPKVTLEQLLTEDLTLLNYSKNSKEDTRIESSETNLDSANFSEKNKFNEKLKLLKDLYNDADSADKNDILRSIERL